MTHKLLLAGLLLTSCSLTACQGGCDEPAPQCYAGTIVGSTCVDGLLIDVDPRYHLGSPAILPRESRPDTVLGRNVIAVVNSGELNVLSSVKTGQRLYFTYTTDRQWNGLCCLANDGVKNPVPRLVLNNISDTPCTEFRAGN